MAAVPEFLRGLVDDAAMFPPASLSLTDAVTAHREHLASPYAALVGPFVVADLRIPDLLEVVDDAHEPLAVSVVVTGGAGAIEPAVRWASKGGMLSLAALEVRLQSDDDLAS